MTQRTCSAEEAVALLRTRDSVAFGLGPAIPDAFMTALGGRDDWEDLVLGGALLLGLYSVLGHPGVSYRCGFYGPAERLSDAAGHRIELVPGGFRQFGPILARFQPRVMVFQGAPSADGASVNLSLHYGATRHELLAAGRDPDRLLVAEVNPKLPRTCTIDPFDNTIPLDVVDVVVEADGDPATLGDLPVTDVDRAVAEHALAYVADESTLQVGIGAIPNIVAGHLATGAGGGYGVHSELFSDGLMALHRAGKVTNTAKGQFPGVSVATFALGSADLYRWLDSNAEVAFCPVEVVNDPDVVGDNHRLVSINGALSLDLYGQVVADHIGGRQISGVGGHEDFTAAADLHLDAYSVIALHATATVDGELRSRIVPALPAGSVVSTPRHHTNIVVTEYGAAELAGCTVRERAHALAAIAHPDFRDELRAAADALDRS